MLNHDDAINNELLDRLVDGELSEAAYRQTLDRLDETPDGWRRCAISFLEQQALRRELMQLLKCGERLNSLDDPELDEAGLEPITEADELHFATTRPDWDGWFRKPWVRWTSALAVGILAFIGGLSLRPFGSLDSARNPNIAQNQRQNDQRNAVANSQRSADGVEIASVTFDDLPNNQSQGLQVPLGLFSRSQGTPKLAPERLPPQFERMLTESNAANHLERRVFFGRTPNGEVLMVPFDRIVHRVNFQ